MKEELEVFSAGEAADGVGVEGGREAFDADLAFGLETAQFVGCAQELALGFASGAVDGGLGAGQERVFRFVAGGRFHLRFGDSAAAETPGGVDDFGGEGLFERALGTKILFEVLAPRRKGRSRRRSRCRR
ncbi:MAG TPA: hypothetical protein VK789_07660 [Bryobacteraceae bacterium]|nr:hypothetical protein [Bryobacteraceae bacterium]